MTQIEPYEEVKGNATYLIRKINQSRKKVT